MLRLSCFLALGSLLLTAPCHANPAAAARIQKNWEQAMDQWTQANRAATTPESRAKVLASRPDATPFARELWRVISPDLTAAWTLEPAAWFLRVAPGLLASNADGSTSPVFAREIETVRKTVETHHLKSPNLIPMCMALVTNADPRALATLEKIQASHPDAKTQGVAALGAAMILKTLGDDPSLMRQRLSYLRKAIIQSADVELGGVTVAKLAEDELYIIRFLTKGRVAPDLQGVDSAGHPLKLADFSGKVVMLVFWSSTMPETNRVLRMLTDAEQKYHGRPLVIVGVNQDPVDKLRAIEGDGSITWKNFADTSRQLAGQYRVGSWPLVYVLDGERKIHYAGAPGSFAEATADALLNPGK